MSAEVLPHPKCEDWKLISLREAPSLPSFPVACLPPVFSRFVQDLATDLEVPIDLPGALTLAAIAASVAKKFTVRPQSNWYESVNLYVLGIADPGERKTPTHKAIVGPIEEHQRRLRSAAGIDPEAENAAKLDAMRLAAITKRLKSAKIDEDERRAHEAEYTTLAAKIDAAPKPPRLVADNVTLERLSSLMAEHDGRMAILSAEGGFFELAAGLYNDRGASNIDLVLKAHASETVMVDRVGRPGEVIENATLTIGILAQPAVLEGLAAKPHFEGRGLLARFLYVVPESKVGSRGCDSPEMRSTVAQDYCEALTRLLEIPDDRHDDGRLRPTVLTFDAGARELFLDYRKQHERQLRPSAQLGAAKEWGSKLPGAVARLAGLLHVAGGNHQARTIDAVTLKKAISLGDYFTAHALEAFGVMACDPVRTLAVQVVKWLKDHGHRTVTRRELDQSLRPRRKTGDGGTLDAALKILTEHHHLRPAPRLPGQVGRPSEVYEVNPELVAF